MERKLLSVIMIVGLVVVIGCDTKDRKNPTEPDETDECVGPGIGTDCWFQFDGTGNLYFAKDKILAMPSTGEAYYLFGSWNGWVTGIHLGEAGNWLSCNWQDLVAYGAIDGNCYDFTPAISTSEFSSSASAWMNPFGSEFFHPNSLQAQFRDGGRKVTTCGS